MLDEWMEQKVDEGYEVVPAYVNPRKIRLASSHVGWRLYLYGSSLKRAVSGFFVHIRSEQDMDIFLRETAERSDTAIARVKQFLKEKARLLAVLDDAGMRLRFATTLYLFGLAALGTLAHVRAGRAAAVRVVWGRLLAVLHARPAEPAA